MSFLELLERRKCAQIEAFKAICNENGLDYLLDNNNSRYKNIVFLTTAFQRSFYPQFGAPDWQAFIDILKLKPEECLPLLEAGPPISEHTRYPDGTTIWDIIEDKPQHIVECVEDLKIEYSSRDLNLEGIAKHINMLKTG